MFLAVRLSVALAACNPDSPASSTPDSVDTAGPDDGAPGRDAALGGFVINLIGPVVEGSVQQAPGHTAVLGKIYDRALPVTVAWRVGAEGGGCQFLTPMIPFCRVDCGGSAACTEGGTCVEHPRALRLGRVHIKGLASGELDMDEVAGSYQPARPIPYPPLPEGAKVEVTAPGGLLGPLRLESLGIAPLELTSPVQLISGQPLVLTWKPPGQANIGRIEILLDLSHHGGSKGKIQCDVADTGELTIPAEQITALMRLGISGFPTVIVTRVASGETATRLGRVTLRVVASVERAVEIEGLHSCTADQDCPAGMSCQVDLKCK